MGERDLALAKTICGDIDLIANVLDDFKQAHNEYFSVLGDERINDPLLPFRYALTNLKETVNAFADEPSPQKALRTINLLLIVCGQPDAISVRLNLVSTAQGIKAKVQNAAHAISNAWSSFVQQIQSIIQGISSALWLLVSNYLNLKEWSVKGSISTPAITSLFGISGSAEIQFTFEK